MRIWEHGTCRGKKVVLVYEIDVFDFDFDFDFDF